LETLNTNIIVWIGVCEILTMFFLEKNTTHEKVTYKIRNESVTNGNEPMIIIQSEEQST